MQVIILLGLVSLFADIVYEGARSITGPFLATLGASGAAVAFISGFSELLGYGIRLFAGRLAGETRFIWPSIWLGYALNLLSVPGLALANTWAAGAGLIFTERLGKGIRSPGRDVVLTEAAGENRGFAFGLHQTLDQTGAIIGPLIVAAALYLTHNRYQTAFSFLLLPAALALMCLVVAMKQTRHLTPETQETLQSKPLPRSFWLYALAIGLLGAGFVDFPLIAFNLTRREHISDSIVPLIYALAMGTQAVVALPLGKLFDKFKFSMLRLTAWLIAPTSILIFSTNIWLILAGALLWGIGMTFQSAIAKAAIAEIVTSDKRAIAFGTFGLVFGIFWFAGSAAIGVLYDRSLNMAIGLSLALEIAGAAVLLFLPLESRKVTGEN